MENEWMSFWQALGNSEEDEMFECEDGAYQRIFNNGDHCFMWEESGMVVRMSGEFLGMKWRKVKQ